MANKHVAYGFQTTGKDWHVCLTAWNPDSCPSLFKTISNA